jgi:hypothetical protein
MQLTALDKGKVEQGGVHYVKRNFLAGREPEPTDGLNARLVEWCREVAGERVHGTTQVSPWARFSATEQAALLELPAVPYDMATWKAVGLQRDCHLAFERAWYLSLSTRSTRGIPDTLGRREA